LNLRLLELAAKAGSDRDQDSSRALGAQVCLYRHACLTSWFLPLCDAQVFGYKIMQSLSMGMTSCMVQLS
jgi:hypothetical protein